MAITKTALLNFYLLQVLIIKAYWENMLKKERNLPNANCTIFYVICKNSIFLVSITQKNYLHWNKPHKTLVYKHNVHLTSFKSEHGLHNMILKVASEMAVPKSPGK